MKTLWIILVVVAGVSSGMEGQGEAADSGSDYAVVLHGMGRTRISMKRMEMNLRDAGYEVINLTYPSRETSVAGLTNWLARTLKEHCPDSNRKVHFVTHSLGGIVVRAFLKDRKEFPAGRVVMLAPPNKGSEIVDRFRDWGISERSLGPAGEQLGTGTNDVPLQLGPVNFELGVIAGDRTLNPLYSHFVEGVDDGKVSVENAKVEGMRDFLVVHSSHTWMMQRKAVIEQVIHFLKNGRFETVEE